MFDSYSFQPKIECAGRKDAVGEVENQAVVAEEKGLEMHGIVLKQGWGPCCKDA